MKVRGLFTLNFTPPAQLALNFYTHTVDQIIEYLQQYYTRGIYPEFNNYNTSCHYPDSPLTPVMVSYNEVSRVKAKASYAKYTNTALCTKNGYRCQFHPRYRRCMF